MKHDKYGFTLDRAIFTRAKGKRCMSLADSEALTHTPHRSLSMPKPRYFKREVTAIITFLACGHCGVEQPAEWDGELAKHCTACGEPIDHQELCSHCHAVGTDDDLAMFATFKACPMCGHALTQPVAA